MSRTRCRWNSDRIEGERSWDGRCWKGNPGYDPVRSALWWRENLEKLHSLYPDKPILVTEFGYPCLEGVFDNAVGEDMQARAIEAEFQGMDAPSVCGATIWCYADHPWPEEDFIRSLTVSPFGVVTRDRKPKAACEVVERIFAKESSSDGESK